MSEASASGSPTVAQASRVNLYRRQAFSGFMNIDRITGLARRCRALALATILALVPASAAWAAGAIDALERFLADTTSAQGTFIQESAGGSSSRVERSEGSFAFERPGRFRWEVVKPYEQLMVADGREVWFHDLDLDQVTVRPLAEAMGATPAAILFGTGVVDSEFALADAGSADGLDWLVATPHSSDAGFESIRIGFGDALPRAMEVLDAFGRTIRFRFDSIDTSPDFAPGTFRFEPPAGTDVIRQ